MLALPVALILLILPSAHSFSFTFSGVTQCQSSIVNLSGASTSPPISFLIAPLNATISSAPVVPIPDSSSDTINLPAFPLPARSDFVVIGSDAGGFGTGGVSPVLSVADSDQSSCLINNNSDLPKVFSLPLSPPIQCQDFDICWDPSNPRLQSTVSITGVVPGGSVFPVASPLQGASSVNWTASVSKGTQFMLVFSTGGTKGTDTPLETSPLYTMGGDGYTDASCLQPNGPATTMSIGPTPTMTSKSSGSNQNTPFIAGLIIGAVALILLAVLLVWLFRRRRIVAQELARRAPSVEPAFVARPRSNRTSTNLKPSSDTRRPSGALSGSRHVSVASSSAYNDPIPTPDLDLSALAEVDASPQFIAPSTSSSHPPSPSLSREGSSAPPTEAVRHRPRKSLLFSPNPTNPPSPPPP